MKKFVLLVIIGCSYMIANSQSITISEINYKSAAPSLDVGDWFELHNYGPTAIDISGWKAMDSLATQPYTFPANTIIAANDYLVVYRKAALFSFFFPTITKKVGPFSFKLDSFDSLKIVDINNNVIVKAVINSNRFWPDGADGEGRTMELINQNTNIGLMDSTSWRDGCMLGSPASAPVACNDPIIITEINYNNDSARNIGEFIEFYNTKSDPFDLSGWVFKDGSDSVGHSFTFPANTILAPSAYLAVSNDTTALYQYKARATSLIGQYNFSLKNSGELIRLYNQFGELKFSFHYRDSIPWTDSADGKGYTLEIKNKIGRTNDPKNYFAGCLGGSPGMAYTPNCTGFFPLAIINNAQKMQPTIFINTTNELMIRNNMDYDKIIITDAVGRFIKQITNIKSNNKINIADLQAGLYIVTMYNGHNKYTQKIKIN
jgi:Lamin Tail Domain/Secretion system C-terminal sorting domain